MKIKRLLVAVAAVLLISSVFVITGCEKEKNLVRPTNTNIVDSDIQKDAISYYGKVVKLSDFPSEKVIKEIDIHKIYQLKNDLGSTPERAIVDLIFDKDGVLYTAKRYNSEAEQNDREVEVGYSFYYTDIKTFRDVTSLKEAIGDYADVLPDENGNPVWLFDPYVNFFTKKDEFSSLSVNQYASKSVPSWAKLGNIIYARWNDNNVSDYYGHTGGITKEPSSSSSNIGYLMRSTKITEASNSGKIIAGIFIGTPDGVFERYMSTNGSNGWNSSLVYQRYALWYPNMTSSQRSQIANYMKNQKGEAYQLWSSKNNSSKWYCSKLQWKAYKYVLGIDIDRNGGSRVYPNDIKYSNKMVGMSF